MSTEQFAAASPCVSSWISASAGSGKTKVLIDRLVRLLLAGETLDSILCFTYTNAAAAEMRERLRHILCELSKMTGSDREAHLTDLLRRSPTDAECDRAQGLFEVFTRSGSTLRIQTIHSFCKDFLETFAPMTDSFGPIMLLEDGTSARLLHEVQETCLLTEEDPAFSEAFQTLSKFFTFDQIDETLLALLAKRYEFAQFLGRLGESSAGTFETKTLKDFLINRLGGETTASSFDRNETKLLAQTLMERNPGESDRKVLLNVEKGKFSEAFLTRTQTVRKKLLSAALQKNAPKECQALDDQARRFEAALKQQKICDQIEKTQAFVTVARVIFQRYQQSKHNKRQVDFEDLIVQTHTLLRRALTDVDLRRAIIHFFPICHLFLDEAQDTSPQQWQIVLRLVQTLFERGNGRCTLFVVGDIKQSIYSFQGSKPWLFQTLQPVFKDLIEAQGGTFQTVALQTSYRTAPAPLEVVDAIFQKDSSGVAAEGEYRPHRSARSYRGFVERWTVERQQLPSETPGEERQETEEEALARTTINGVCSLLDRQINLPSIGHQITSDDLLILSRRRSPVLKLIANGLTSRGVAVAGLDKRILSDTLTWADLVALARFFTAPVDDYNLACLLKSPILSAITDEELWQLCANRSGALFDVLLASPETASPLVANLQRQLIPYRKEAQKAVTKDLFYAFWHRVLAQVRPFYDARAEAVFDVFLDATQEFLRQKGPDWTAFLDFLQTRTFVQTTPTTPGIRFMTVHGSKGLQAPVVIVLDEGIPLSLAREKWFWFNEEGKAGILGTDTLEGPLGLVLMPPQHMMTPAVEAVRSEALRELVEEDRRLLYVALTRAQDGLIVVGSQKNASWSEQVAEAIQS